MELTPFARLAMGLEEAKTLPEVLWAVAREAIGTMKLEDCVIYLVDHDRGVCVQAAAYGPKNPQGHQIANPLELPIGRGIVGRVAATGQPVLVPDVRTDPDYIPDDRPPGSELAVPLTVDGVLVGVIDSEHSQVGFFTTRHLQVFMAIAQLAAPRIEGLRLLERVRERTAAVSRLKEFYERILDQLPIPLTVLSPHGMFEYVNPAAERNPELREWMIGRSVTEYGARRGIDPAASEARLKAVHEAATTAATVEYDETLTLKKGRRALHMTVAPIRDADGAVSQVIGAGVNLTGLREVEDQLRQSQKLEVAGRLAGGVAHDFNNLLTVVRGIGDLLRSDASQTADARALIEELLLAVRRGTDLTRQLLSFTRRSDGTPVSFALDSAVDGTARLVKRLLPERIVLRMELAAKGAHVSMESGALDQVLLNLAANARDAMPGEGSLTMRTVVAPISAEDRQATGLAEASYAHIDVIDSGTGMPPEVLSRIFEAFFTTKGVGKGTGLGLATVSSIVKQAGGAIRVSSVVGQGTTFRVLLPLAAPPKTAGVVTTSMPALRLMTRPARILLVDDEDFVRRVTSRILAKSGLTVLEARFGSEALELAAKTDEPIDLLLTDVQMPGMDGPEVATRVRALRKGIHVMYMSGHVDDPELLERLAQEGTELIEKPFTADGLLRRVQDTLATAPRA